MDSKACKDTFSEYVDRNKTKGMTVTLDATYSWRNMIAYFLHFKPVKISSYKNYFCCIVSPFLVIWFLMLRIAHFNFLHNLYTFPIQPLNSLYMLPTDLIYDFVSISIATFVLLLVAFIPVVYFLFITGARFVAKQIVSCESILEA